MSGTWPVALLGLLTSLPAMAASTGFDLQESESPPAAATEPGGGDWRKAQLLPAAIGLAAAEARRASAASVGDLDQLKLGPDGAVDLALATVIDLTLRNNIDLLVRSYDPALSAETLRAREAIFDPMLRFTLSLFSSTNPTSSTLEGAAALSNDQTAWNIEGQKLLPWGGTASFAFDNSRDKTNNAFAYVNPVYSSNLGLALNQPLLRDFGRDMTEREIRVAQNSEKASREGFRADVIAKVQEAVNAYWALYGRIQDFGVQQSGLALAQDLLRINRTRVEVGTMAPLDVSLAEAEVARNEEQVIVAEFELRNAEDRLRQLVNVPVGSPLWKAELRPVDQPQVEEVSVDVDQAIATAFANRPEIKQQDLVIANGEINLAYARNQLLPGLALQASWSVRGLGGTRLVREGLSGELIDVIPGGYGDALDQLFSYQYDTWRVGAVLELPVFNRLARANHAAATLDLRRSRDSLESVKQAIGVEVRQLARAVESSRQKVIAARATRTHQQKRLEAESKKFEHGLSTNFEVQQAQKDLTDARSSVVGAVTAYQIALSALERGMGTILESRGIRIAE